MMRRGVLWVVAVAALVAGWGAAVRARAGEPEPGTMRVDGNVEFLANGDARAALVCDVDDGTYATLKRTTPNPQKLLKNVSSGRSDFELDPSSRATYDDAASAVRLDVVQLGALRNLGSGKWEFPVERDQEYVNHVTADGRTVFFFFGTSNVGGMPAKGQTRYRLPAGAADPEWDAAHARIRYKLARSTGSGQPSVELAVQTKPRIMSALYKVYGLGTPDLNAQWVAKAVLKNSGTSVVTDVRARWRFTGYSEWSGWDKFPEMVPGQTAVSVYYPNLDGKIAQLTSNTPADIAIEWRYTDAEGKTHEDSDATRVVVLGRHDFVFFTAERGADAPTYAEQTPEAPLVAAFVSRDDPVVKQFAAMANKIAGGVGSTQNAESLIACMGAIYELECRNDFTYQFPAGLADRSVSFDPKLVQHIKYPRDVIRDKSGTCIDLAICYAAVANAIGMDVSLALIPGHCFPIVRWNGRYFPVEATCIRGGVRFATDPRRAPATFEEALKAGAQELEESMRSGQIVIVDVQEWWTRGVSGPELEPLPANVLAEWGISVEGAAGAPRAAPGGEPAAPGPVAPGPVAPPAVQAGGFEGTWTGTVPDGAGGTLPVTLTIEKGRPSGFAARSTVRSKGADGRAYDVVKTYIGTDTNGSLGLVCQSMMVTDAETGVAQEGWPDGQVTAQIKDGRLVGRSSSGNGSVVEFSFERKR